MIEAISGPPAAEPIVRQMAEERAEGDASILTVIAAAKKRIWEDMDLLRVLGVAPGLGRVD